MKKGRRGRAGRGEREQASDYGIRITNTKRIDYTLTLFVSKRRPKLIATELEDEEEQELNSGRLCLQSKLGANFKLG